MNVCTRHQRTSDIGDLVFSALRCAIKWVVAVTIRCKNVIGFQCSRKSPSVISRPIPSDCWGIIYVMCSNDMRTTLALRAVSTATYQPLIHTNCLPGVHRMLRCCDIRSARTSRSAMLTFVAGHNPDAPRLSIIMRWCVQQPREHVADWLTAWTCSGLPVPPSNTVLASGVIAAVALGDADTLQILGSCPFFADHRHCDVLQMQIAKSLGHVDVAEILSRPPYGLTK